MDRSGGHRPSEAAEICKVSCSSVEMLHFRKWLPRRAYLLATGFGHCGSGPSVIRAGGPRCHNRGTAGITQLLGGRSTS